MPKIDDNIKQRPTKANKNVPETPFGPKRTFIWSDDKKVTRETYEKDTNVREDD